MLPVILAFDFISLVVGVICYLTTLNIYFGIGVFLIYVVYFLVFQYKRIKKYELLIQRVHSCCFFINSFIITMSVKESFDEGYKSGLRIQDKNLELYSKQLDSFSDYEKVKYLRNYFKLAIYKMFLNVLEIYQDQGGNILNMSDNIIRECTNNEKMLTDSQNLGIKHFIEFIVLWALAFAVLLFLKFGIGDFYNRMLQNGIFSPLILIFFLICLVSIHMFLNSFLKLSIKEEVIEWKR